MGDRAELSRLLGREVPVDAAGHPRLSEVPLGRILKEELQRRFAARNDKITLVAHTLGYELRCARPTTSDMGYTRDLGHGGVRMLLDSTLDLPTGAMVTLQSGNLVPVPFADMVDPKTNRTRIRQVNISSYSYRVARAYMIRLEKADFDSETMLASLAQQACMTPRQFRERYEPIVEMVARDRDDPPAQPSRTSAAHNGIPSAAW